MVTQKTTSNMMTCCAGRPSRAGRTCSPSSDRGEAGKLSSIWPRWNRSTASPPARPTCSSAPPNPIPMLDAFPVVHMQTPSCLKKNIISFTFQPNLKLSEAFMHVLHAERHRKRRESMAQPLQLSSKYCAVH